MGILRATKYKTLLKLSAAVFVLSAVLIPVFSLGKHVSAASNLTFTWKDAQTITVGGTLNGDIVGSVATSGQFPYSGSVVATPSNLCNYLSTTVNLDNNTVTVDSKNVVESGVTGSVRCTSELLGINGSLPVGGTRPSTAVETSDQQKVNIYLVSNLNKDASPSSVKFTLKNSSGKTIATPSVPKTVSAVSSALQGSGSAGTNYNVDYDYTFTLVPDTYSICFSALDSSCHSFTKVKYEATSKSYGVRGSYNYIKASIHMDVYITTGSSFTISSQSVQLKQGSNIVATQKTPTYVHTPTSSEIAGSGSLSKINISFATVTFSNVSPGNYQVCLVSNNSCVSVTKAADQATSPDPIVLNGDPSDVLGVKSQYDANQCGNTANASTSGCAVSNTSCESSGVTLGWIVCPIIIGLSNAVDGIYNHVITPMLQEDTNQASPVWEHTKAAWSNFRVYGDVFLVIALLVIVFGQSIGGGLIDAYSAKKILPRLLLAAILINLSYYIVVLLIDITNVVGGGLVSLITAPFGFSGSDVFTLAPNAGTSVITLGAISGVVTAAIVGGTEFLGFILPFILLPALLTFIAIFMTVLIRRGLIILLIIASPVAFALYCLPNTEKYFKQWWDMLFRTLLVYPIIASLFALSKVMSVAISAGGDSGPVAKAIAGVISIIALVVPLFLIPFAFKIAGGIIGQASQAFNSLSKRAHKGILGDPRNPDSIGAKAKSKLGTRYASKNLSGEAIGARLKPSRWVSERGRAALGADLDTIRNKQLASYAKKGASGEWAEINSQDSNVLKDLATYKTGAESKEAAYAWARNRPAELANDFALGKLTASERDRKLAAIPEDLRQKLYTSATADRIGRNAASRRRALLSAPTIGYEIAGGAAGWNEATAIMKDIAGGEDNGTYRAMVNEFQYIAKNSGRTDLAGATNGDPYSGLKARNIANPYQLATTEKAKSIMSHANYTLDALLHGSDEDKIGAATWYQEISTAYNNATGENRDALFDAMKLLDGAKIQDFMDLPTGSGTKIKQLVPDPADANKKIYVDRDETVRDVAARKARAYQPPDPNKLTT